MVCIVGRRSHCYLRLRMSRFVHEPGPTWDANAKIH
jgi:hypothetical protein